MDERFFPVWVRRALDLVFPPHCVACGTLGEWLCPSCIGALHRLHPPLCPRCGSPRQNAGRACRVCRRLPDTLDGIRSVAFHRGPMRSAVYALKYGGVSALAPTLGQLMATCWQESGVPVDAIVPVPLHASRERRRGYNQALKLAQVMGDILDIPVLIGIVSRVRETQPQVGLSREERWQNVSGAFASTRALEGLTVLAVDDVLTTGATLGACARALKTVGARAVWGITLARAANRLPTAPENSQERDAP